MQKIIILVLAACFALCAFAPQHSFTVTGKVTDEKGNPIPRASVREKGGRTGANATSEGNFSITVTSENTILQVSATGFETKEIIVSTKRVFNIVLKNDKMALCEVVVVGYGSSSKTPARRMNYTAQELYQKEAQSYTPAALADSIGADADGEDYDHIVENEFLSTTANPLSTFSIDVDAAAYSNIRRFLKEGSMPPAGAVRIEEMVNYFRYEYPQPKKGDPFTVNTEIAACPWNSQHKLALVALQGKNIPENQLPASNLVFLIDVSGSMMTENKLPLLKKSMKLLVDKLREEDNVAIVVYAGNAGLVLPSTSGANKTKIKDAIDALQAGGSTAGGAGIQLAYQTAEDNFMEDGNNRVILCTDGDFNVGVRNNNALETLIEEKRGTGIFLTVLGFGTGNYQDAKMQRLADKGNGNHAYIDQLDEAKKVLVNEFGGTLFTIAKDVKLQVEFNPAAVQGYRLIGYENRMLAKEDFNNDKKDAGEMGSGHTVTALYEIIPAGTETSFIQKVDGLKYQQAAQPAQPATSNQMLTVKIRYKQPDGETSKLLELPVADKNMAFELASDNFRFAAAVASFGMLLRNSKFKQQSNYDMVSSLASAALSHDNEGYRKEFVKLVKKAAALTKTALQNQQGGTETAASKE
jgi:Ca-activated chloride channel homolog